MDDEQQRQAARLSKVRGYHPLRICPLFRKPCLCSLHFLQFVLREQKAETRLPPSPSFGHVSQAVVYHG